MITKQANYLDFLGTPQTKMLIPVFQRVYTWGTWQCEELWDDICRAGRDGQTHFIGSAVFTREEAPQDSGYSQIYNIVDGQQRTTTVTLLLIALRDHLRATGSSVCGHDAASIDAQFLQLQTPTGTAPKFTAAPNDQETLHCVLTGAELPDEHHRSKFVLDNYQVFADHMAKPDFDADAMWRGLESLFAIMIELETCDNPQLVFEGINSKGLSLSTADLLRNKLFFGNDEAEQERLLREYWEPIEALFADDPSQNSFNAAIRAWLCKKDPSLEKHSRHELYSVFRKYLNEQYSGTTEELMQELLKHCDRFKRLIKSPMMKKHVDWANDNVLLGTSRVAPVNGGMFP